MSVEVMKLLSRTILAVVCIAAAAALLIMKIEVPREMWGIVATVVAAAFAVETAAAGFRVAEASRRRALLKESEVAARLRGFPPTQGV